MSFLMFPNEGGQNYDAAGKHCPERDSCNFGRSSRGSLEMDWRQRNCFCDADCAVYGDCCIDARAFDPAQQRDHFERFDCRTLRQYGSIYMRSECDAGWKLPNIAAACKGSTSKGDPLARMPVTSSTTGITFTNYYCAVCNHAGRDVVFWKPRLECPTLQVRNPMRENINIHFSFRATTPGSTTSASPCWPTVLHSTLGREPLGSGALSWRP